MFLLAVYNSGRWSISGNYYHCVCMFVSPVLCVFVFVTFLDLKHDFLNGHAFTLVCVLSLGISMF